MNIIVRVISLVGSLLSFGAAIYVYLLNKDIRNMYKKNKKMGDYLKEKSFLFMKNKGSYDTEKEYDFSIGSFSQSSDYIIRGKIE